MTDANKQAALDYHAKPIPGKLSVELTKPTATARDLALAYSPGVAEPVREIAREPIDDAPVRRFFRDFHIEPSVRVVLVRRLSRAARALKRSVEQSPRRDAREDARARRECAGQRDTLLLASDPTLSRAPPAALSPAVSMRVSEPRRSPERCAPARWSVDSNPHDGMDPVRVRPPHAKPRDAAPHPEAA